MTTCPARPSSRAIGQRAILKIRAVGFQNTTASAARMRVRPRRRSRSTLAIAIMLGVALLALLTIATDFR